MTMNEDIRKRQGEDTRNEEPARNLAGQSGQVEGQSGQERNKSGVSGDGSQKRPSQSDHEADEQEEKQKQSGGGQR